jgi:spermidine synthase
VLGRLQVAIGVAAAGVLLLLSNYLHVALWSFEVAGSLTGQTDLRTHHRVSLLISSAVTLLPPAILMGGVFPLAAAAYQRGLGDLGARIGRLYAVNTIGAVLGSLGAGFVLVPLMGAPWTAAVVAGTSLLAGAVVLGCARAATPERAATPVAWKLPLVGAIVAGVLITLAAPWEPFILRSHPFSGPRARENVLEETLQGVVCQVSVVRNERDNYTLLYTDEFQAAGTKPEYRYMRMLAHLPVALVEDPERVLVICFGTGTTCGSVSTHDAVKRLDIVEISPEVLAVADRFTDVNRDVLNGAGRDDLDVDVHVDDGRNFVLRSREQWNVITLEPLMPYTPAAIHFYTEDFYRECAPRLAPGGLMCQWIPLQGMSGDHFLQLVESFVRVFPDSGVFFVDGAVALVGGNEPLELDYTRMATALAQPAVRADLDAIGYADPVRALGTYVSGGSALREYLDENKVEPITDERPVLEFHPIPSNTVLKHLYENLQHMVTLRKRLTRLPVTIAATPERDGIQDRLRLALSSGNFLLEGMAHSEQSGLLVRLGLETDAARALSAAREAFSLAHSMDPGDAAAQRNYDGVQRVWQVIEANGAIARQDLKTAERHLARAVEYPALRQEDHAFTLLASVRNRRDNPVGGLAAALEATQRFPRGAQALAERAFARNALGDVRGAARDYRRALAGEPLAVLGPRLANGAERVLGKLSDDAETDPDAVIARALSGESTSAVPQRLVLALLAQEFPAAYVRAFETDLQLANDNSGAELPRALAFENLRLGNPEGAVDAARRCVLQDAAPEAVRAAAARLLADRDPASLARFLTESTSVATLTVLARAAVHALDRRVADGLAEHLDHTDEAVRAAAQRGLFALVGDGAPGLAVLDPKEYGSRGYRAAVGLIRSWWIRQRDTFHFKAR